MYYCDAIINIQSLFKFLQFPKYVLDSCYSLIHTPIMFCVFCCYASLLFSNLDHSFHLILSLITMAFLEDSG